MNSRLEMWKWICRVMLAWVLAVTLLPSASLASDDIVVLESNGAPYDRSTDFNAGLPARKAVAQGFYATHTDSYDFLVVLPTFDVDLGKDTIGLHTLVSNNVAGTGKPVGSGSVAYGSAGRLKGYIDLGGLRPLNPQDVEGEASVLAHEVAHQWSGEVGFKETPTSNRSTELLGLDGAHWSFFLDSEASVLLGSDWEPRGPQSFESVANKRRYSALDLYLMGFLSPQEVAPVTLLSPTPDEPRNDPAAIPPPDGTQISATSRTVSIDQIILAEGARTPNSSNSQKQFRAAFILLMAPGHSATAEQIAYADSLRHSFENHFFFLTRGLGVFETELVEQAPGAVAQTPGVELGVSYLLSHQSQAGNWGATPESSLRETQQAMEALRQFLSSEGVTDALGGAQSYLNNRQPTDVDGLARLSLALQGSNEGALASLRARIQSSGSVGLSPGYRSTLLDTALLGLALTQPPLAADATPAVTQFLLQQQNADGGWSSLPGSPSRFEPTALVLEYLARVPRTQDITTAANRALQFFHEHYTSQGFFLDEGSRAAATGWAVTSLASWRQLTATEAAGAQTALLSRQRQDGSWEGSVVDTSLALRALRILLTPNLAVSASDISVPTTQVMEGDSVVATVGVLNTGYTEARNVLVQAFDSHGAPLGEGVRVESIAAGGRAEVQLTLDTHLAAGSVQAFFVADPNGEIDESQESDNRAAIPFIVLEAPTEADLFVKAGSVTVSPASINRLPSQVTVSARVGNLGKTAAPQVDVAVRMGTQVLATSQVALGAQSSQDLSWTVQLNSFDAAGVITVEVDPANTVQEPVETNNSQTVTLGRAAGVDLRVTSLTAPATVDQGHDITFQYELANGGTSEATTGGTLEIFSGGSSKVATLNLPSHFISAGGQVTGQLVWRANVAGSLQAVLKTQYPGDLDSSNDTGTAAFTVQASTLPNLMVGAGSLSITPEPPLETQPATAAVDVRNSGQGEARDFLVEFYLGDPDAGGTRVHSEQISSLAAGATVHVTGALTLPRDSATSLYVVLDSAQAVSEFDEDDNRSFITISPVPIADLKVSSASIQPSPAFPRENTSVPVTVSVLNSGGQRATDIPVELLRVGASGSEESIGQATISAIEAGQSGEAVITWDTTGLKGLQKLIVVVNGGQTVPEQRSDNNRAERQVSVQDASLALTEPYFSPNGDGIRDTTELTYRLASEAPVEALIVDSEGNPVRTLTAASAIASRLPWDGRSTEGRIVPDGAYSIHVRTVAPAPEVLLGTLTAVVDTNRTPLDSSEPSALELENLEGTATADSGMAATAMPDETGVVFYGTNPATNQCGIYYQLLGGAPAQRLTPDGWSCGEYDSTVNGPAISPDGKWVAFYNSTYCASGSGQCDTLELLSVADHSLRDLVTIDESQEGWLQSSLAPVFSSDSTRVYYVRRSRSASLDITLEAIHIDSSGRQIIAHSESAIAELSLSPDGQRMSVVEETGALALIRLSDGVREEVLPPQTISDGFTEGGILWGHPYFSMDLRHDWARSGDTLSYASPGLVETPPGWPDGEIHLPVSPALGSKDLKTGTTRVLFTGPPYSWDFIAGQTAIAVNPVSGRTAFRHWPPMSTNAQLWTVSPSSAARMLLPYDVQGLRWSPSGSFLFGFIGTGTDWSRLRAVITRDNLFVKLTATRTPSSASVSFQGTAADANFSEWQLGVRTYGSTGAFTTIATSSTPVMNGPLAQWIPPAPGMYEAQLLARDLAGNVRTRTTVFGYSLSPAVANVSRAPEYFSPNNDGVLDTTAIHYTVTRSTVLDFQVLDANNQPVLQDSVLHTTPGDFTLSWDGRDGQGRPVPDGEYTLSLDGTRLSVVVDTTPPIAELALIPHEVSGQPKPYLYEGILAPVVAPNADAAQPAETVQIVAADTSLKIQDTNLTEWSLERSTSDEPSVSRPIIAGKQPINGATVIPLEQLRGTFRLRAKDRAGNETLTPPQGLNDHRLFLTFAGDAETLSGSWVLPEQLMPRVRSFDDATVNADGHAVIPRIPSGRYALGLSTTSATHLSSFSVAYLSPSNTWVTDSQNVTAMGESMVVWDARSAGKIPEFEIRALDGENNTVSTTVVLKEAQFRDAACVATRAGEYTAITAHVGGPGLKAEDLKPGAQWRFTAEGTNAVKDLPVQPDFRSTEDGLQAFDHVSTSSLTGCHYTVRFMGHLQDDSPVESSEIPVDLCKVQVTVSPEKELSLSESLRQSFSSAEVFVTVSGHKAVIARFGPFEGTSQSLQLERSMFPALGSYAVAAELTLADGSHVETGPYLDPKDPTLIDSGCNDPDLVSFTPGHLDLSPPERDGDAPLCGVHDPVIYTARISGQSGDGETLQALSVQLFNEQGVAVAQPNVTGVVLGSASVEAVAHIDTQALQEGTYQLRASATWSDGEVSTSGKQPVYVDRNPAYVVITQPSTTGRLCPQSRRGSDGSLQPYLAVEGTVSDDHLESYELFIQEPNGTPQRANRVGFNPSHPTSFTGVLGTIDLSEHSDNFNLLLSARDASGSSYCAVPLAVQVSAPPSIETLSLDPSLFSPDSDGVIDTTALKFAVDQDVSFTLTTEINGETRMLLHGQATQGNNAVAWNGLLEDGSPLADGNYPLRLTVTGDCGLTSEATTLARLDTLAPVARIDFPTEAQVLGGSFTVTGTATDVNLARYELSLGEGTAPTQFTPIASSQVSASGVLGEVPLTSLPVGDYTLQLIVEDQAGHSQQVLRHFKHQSAALLRAASVVPTLISPDGDGVMDTATLGVTLAAPATVSASLLDESGQPLRELVSATALPANASVLPISASALAGLPDGIYKVRVSADSGTGTEEALAALEIDVTQPHLLFSSPVANSVRGAQLTVEGVVDDAHLESWTLTHIAPNESTGQVIASGNAPASGILAAQSGLAEGTHQLVLKGTDRAGHSHEQSVSFTVDTTSPAVSFLSPTNEALLSGRAGPIDVHGHAEDAHLKSVRLDAVTVTGTQTLFSGASLPADGLIQHWAVGSESDGPAELHLVAEDAAGNTSESRISLVLDSTPPVAALTEPHGATHGEGLAFLGSATDTNLSQWELELGRGESASEAAFQQIASSTQPISSGMLTTLASLGDGSYVARLHVHDSAGNESVDVASFTIDSIAPLPSPTLTATVQRPNTVTLTWEPSPSSDVTTYDILRRSGTGAPVSIATVGATLNSYVDLGVPDGVFQYSIVARDAAHNASNPSPEARVEIDSTPPTVSWLAPTAGAQVRGTLELRGTAFSPNDFREYRVSIGAGNEPSTFTLLTHSLIPVSAGQLGELDAQTLPQGSIQTLRLEAEDLIGNVSEARVTFLVDNQPPATPDPFNATNTGAVVTLSWNTTAEDDLLGFVLFRDGAPLGIPSDASPQDLRPYALPSTSRSYTDSPVPDGTHDYYVVAIDRAGNISAPSTHRLIHIERRAPTALITEPAMLERLRQDTWLLAQSDDQDIASIRFEGRSASTDSFSAVGTPVTQIPFTTRLALSQFSGRVVELRAVATDTANKTDAAPASTYVVKDAIPTPPAATALVDGDQVQISWTDSNPAGLVTGFDLSEGDTSLAEEPGRYSGTAEATSTSSGTPEAAYDSQGTSTAWVPASPFPQTWTLTLDQPVLLRGLSVAANGTAHVRLEAQAGDLWVPIASDVVTASSSYAGSSMEKPLEVSAVRVTILSANVGGTGLSDVRLDTQPIEHGTSTLLGFVEPGQHTYQLRAVSYAGTPSETVELSANIYAPTLTADVAETPESTVTLQGAGVPASAQVQLFNDSGAITTTVADAQGHFVFNAPLVPGFNFFQVDATDGAGNHSLLSEPVFVVCTPAPSASLTLALDGVTESDVSLSLAVEGDESDVAGYVLTRQGSGGTVELPPFAAGTHSFIDRGVSNGEYMYSVQAFNASGFRGSASNSVAVTVNAAPPAAPVDVAVEPLPSGSALSVSWAPGDARTVAYRVERAIGADGAFEVLAGSERVLTTGLVDQPLSDGTLYRYRILAFDAYGNLSGPSMIVSGTPVDSTPPAPPRLLHPTVAGKPVTVSASTVDISGLTDPGTVVTLLRNGVPYSEKAAGALTVDAMPLELNLTPTGSGWVSADGERMAYVVQDSTTAALSLAVQSREGELLGTFDGSSFSSIILVTFSPDGQHLALEAYPEATHKREIYIADLSTGELKKAGPATQGNEFSATWAANSHELAYEVAPFSGPASIVVVDTSTDTRRSLTGEDGAPLMAPHYAPDGSSLFALTRSGDTMRLLRMDPESGAPTPLFEAASIERDYAVSRDSERIALVATRDGQRDLHMVSVPTGASVQLTHGAEVESTPAFSWDGHRLAFISGGSLVVHEDGREQRFTGSVGYGLYWTPAGELLTSPNQGLARLELGAGFAFTGVRLESGTTVFSATATDAAQRTGQPAAPIQVTLNATTLPDLAAEVELRPEVPVKGQPFDAFVTVRNQGGGAAPATTLSVAVVSPDGTMVAPQPISIPALPAGGVTTAVVPFSEPTLQGPQLLEAIVDPEQQVDDPVRDNNQVSYPFSVATDEHLAVALSVSPQSVEVDGTSLATITVANPGAAKDVDVEVQLVTPSGELVFRVGDIEHLAPLGAGRSQTFTRSVAVGRTFAGTYQVKAVARQGSELLTETSAPLTINSDRATLLRLATARASYGPGETVSLNTLVRNDSKNTLLDGASYALTVTNASGDSVLATSIALPLLTQGSSYSTPTELPTSGLSPGEYEAQGIVMLGSEQLATATTHFSIVGKPMVVGMLSVLGDGAPPKVRAGQPLTVTFEAGNQGSAAEPSLALRVAITDADTQQIVDEYALSAQAIEVGATVSGQHDFSTDSLAMKSYAAHLFAERPDGTVQELASQSFRIVDGQGPSLRITNLVNGSFLPGSVEPLVEAIDPDSGVVSVEVRPVGAVPFELSLTTGTPLDGIWTASFGLGEGNNPLVLIATDAEGNVSRLSTTVIVDSQPPQISVTGVTDGSLLQVAPVPVVTATDAHLASSTLFLDGQPFSSGATISNEGAHELVVQATDLAGNQAERTVRFTVDLTAPSISVSGVTDGGIFRQSVTPVITIRDRDLKSSTVTLDGQPFVAGTAISAEGTHTLQAQATDYAGNQAQRQVTFTLDQTPPEISISGVSDGGQYSAAVTPVISIDEEHLSTQDVRLNGAPFVPGGSISTDGSYTLTVHAEDLAGWITEKTVQFSVNTTALSFQSSTSASFTRTLALVRAGTCTPTASEMQRVQGFLEAELGGPDRLLTVTAEEPLFLESLRSGVANVAVVVSLGSTGSECGESLDSTEPAAGDSEAVKVRKAWSRELTEQVFAGHTGLVVIRSRPEGMPVLREALGVDFLGSTQQSQLQLPSSVLNGPAYLSTPAGGALLQALKPSVQRAAAWSSAGEKLAGALYTWGQGHSVTFGVDLSSALPAANAELVLRQAVAHVLPASQPAPLGVMGVELRLSSPSRAVQVRSVEALPEELAALWASAQGTLAPGGRGIAWADSLEKGGTHGWRFLVRLPESSGSHTVSASASSLAGSALREQGTWSVALDQPMPSSELLARVRAALEPLREHNPAAVSDIEARLQSVEARSVTQRGDVEAHFEDLFRAIEATRHMSGDASQARKALGDLLQYWEARWYLL